MSATNSYLKKIYNDTLWGAAWFSWYDFPVTDSVLVAGDVSQCALKELNRRFTRMTVFNEQEEYNGCVFSAVLVCGGLGSREKNELFLDSAGKMLSENGVLLWAADNKLGVRFLCGDVHFSDEGQYFSRKEWEAMFQEAGMPVTGVYGLMPGWHLLRNVFSDKCPLSSDNFDRLEYHYVKPECMFADEREILENIALGANFFVMANALLLEYRAKPVNQFVLYADMYADKEEENASVIMRIDDGTVIKKPLFVRGDVEHIYRYGEELRNRGLKVIPQKYDLGNIVMPYLDAPLLTRIMAEVAAESVEGFHQLLLRFWKCILASSELTEESNFPIKDIDLGPTLVSAYLDMIPGNAFLINDEFVFFDQEYCCSNYPAKFVLYRSLETLYGGKPEIEDFVPIELVKKWFALCEVWPFFHEVDRNVFIRRVRQENIYANYQKKYGPNYCAIARNKKALSRMDMLAEYDLFATLGERKVVLFGSGMYADRYLQQYGYKYPPIFMIDNEEKKWNTYKNNIEIVSPEIITGMDKNKLMIIICSRYDKEIGKQLKAMGIEDYKVY